MASIFTTKKGNKVTLLNPSEKGAKYSRELREGRRFTNDGYKGKKPTVKIDKYGAEMGLTAEQRAFRAGYLQSQADSAGAYCAKAGITSKRKENRKKRRAAAAAKKSAEVAKKK